MFETVYATNGKDAMELYHSWHPDIIVLDIMLPIMTGYSVLKEIREELEDKKTTIIMATSLQGKEDIADCSRVGIQGYITKPFKYKEIGNQVIKCYQGE
jgi:CheY-like chemotaxis protein